MKTDEINPEAACEGDSQNRRQFFNGLGKWSVAIVAAITTLREGLDDSQSRSTSAFDTPSGSGRDSPQLIARKKPKGPKGPHTDRAFYKHSQHSDNVSRKKPAGGKDPAGGGTLEKAE